MFGEYDTSFSIEGTVDDILAIIAVLKEYEDRQKDVYIERLDLVQFGPEDPDGDRRVINKIRISEKDIEEIKEYVKQENNQVFLSASGPYGKFGLLEEVDIIEKAAETAPNACFTAYLDGEDQSVKGELKEGKLYLYYKYPDESFEEGFYDDDEILDDDIIDDVEDEEEWDDISIYDPVAKDYLDPYDEDDK